MLCLPRNLTTSDHVIIFTLPPDRKLVTLHPYTLVSPSSKSVNKALSLVFLESAASITQDAKLPSEVEHSPFSVYTEARTLSWGMVYSTIDMTSTLESRLLPVHSSTRMLWNPWNGREVNPGRGEKHNYPAWVRGQIKKEERKNKQTKNHLISCKNNVKLNLQ